MVNIYISGQRIDLFKDENIFLTSKLNDIEKLDNVFTDFTQSFTVPATDRNNTLFNHYYDPDVGNSFNTNVRVPGYIEYNTLPFRFGNIQLESVKTEMGYPSSYKITFYGDLKQLTDLFGEDRLDQLDNDVDGNVDVYDSLSQFDFEMGAVRWGSSMYDDNNIGLNGDIITPLISLTDRNWEYNNGDTGTESNRDIGTVDGALRFEETRQALRIFKVIEAIEIKYDITFSRDFFGTAAFRNIFMWMNKKEGIVFSSTDFLHTGTFSGINTYTDFYDEGLFLSCNTRFYSQEYDNNFTDYLTEFKWDLSPDNSVEQYDLFIIDEEGNVVVEKLNISGDNSISKTYHSVNIGDQLPEIITRKRLKLVIRTGGTLIFDVDSSVFYEAYVSAEAEVYVNVENTTTPFSISNYYDTSGNIPDILVIEFVQNLMKMFKLVIRPSTTINFDVHTIDDYYNKGNILDLTRYIDIKSITYKRPNIYSEINFNFKKTKNILGEKFRKDNDPFYDKIGYGDLSGKYNVASKSKLDVKVIFENMMFERLSYDTATQSITTDIYVGKSITSSDDIEFKPNKSGPILFYNNGVIKISPDTIVTDFKGLTNSLYYSYLIGNTNDEILPQVTNSLNWGSEIDMWHDNNDVQESLYSNYWNNWLTTIYDLRQRKVSCVAYDVPPNIIDELSLNDRIIINTNRYKIEDFKINLLTGKIDFNLFNDIFSYNQITPVSPDRIYTNVGRQYYDFIVDTEGDWSVGKFDTGDGTDWVTILNSSGSGKRICTILIEKGNNASDREMRLIFNIDGDNHWIPINQTRLWT